MSFLMFMLTYKWRVFGSSASNLCFLDASWTHFERGSDLKLASQSLIHHVNKVQTETANCERIAKILCLNTTGHSWCRQGNTTCDMQLSEPSFPDEKNVFFFPFR